MPHLLNSAAQLEQNLNHQHQGASIRKRSNLAPGSKQPVKVRRTRQPRNPQLSVARRNERERNRVKMVNNGFALLREHLPIEDLQAHSMADDSGDDTPTPDCGAAKGQASKNGKKFSKVETLRAAIARIRMLEELIRSTEPGFESMNIQQSGMSQPLDCDNSAATFTGSTGSQQSSVVSNHGPYDMDEPLSVCEPLSCNSVGSSHSPIQQVYTPQHCQPFPKQEPANSPEIGHHQQQIHHHHQQQQQQQQMEIPSHTHLWIQQHQNSFIEQQQQHYSQMESPVASSSSSTSQHAGTPHAWLTNTTPEWNNHRFVPSPETAANGQQQVNEQEQSWIIQNNQQQQQQQFTQQQQQQNLDLNHHQLHQHHHQLHQQQQISLYSQ